MINSKLFLLFSGANVAPSKETCRIAPAERMGRSNYLQLEMLATFDRVCIEHGIEHRLTKPHHPWTNGQAERMNRPIKDATVKVYHYGDLGSLKAHVLAYVTAYNFAKHLKVLKCRTPYQVMWEVWTKAPSIFKINLHYLVSGPHTQSTLSSSSSSQTTATLRSRSARKSAAARLGRFGATTAGVATPPVA